MSTEKELKGYFEDKFNRLKVELNGSQAAEISLLRQEAFTSFAEKGFPLAKNEEYKYTPITKTLLKTFKLEAPGKREASVVPPFNEHLIPELEGFILVYYNGRLVFRSNDLPDTISIESIEDLNQKRQGELKDHLAKLADHRADSFTALNTAFFNQGALIKIASGATFSEPVIIYHLSDGRHGTSYVQTRHLVIVGKQAKASLIEVNKNIDNIDGTFLNTVSEIFLEESARLAYQKIQLECSGAIQVGTTHIGQEANSYLSCTTVTTGGRMIRNNLNIAINGENCESHMYGLYLLQGQDHVDNHTVVDHKIRHSFSNELYKGIIDDSATGVFNGKIFVRPDAQKTNAFQSNKNILLSDQSSMNTKPQLEIWADDVKCSHGATTGQLDEEQMFYLRSRGLDKTQARGLLLYAFATETLENIDSQGLKDHLEKAIEKRLYQQGS